MNEWLMIVLLGAGTMLVPAGGTGWKPARRFVWPAVAGGLLAYSGYGWESLLVALTLVLVNLLAYGDRTSWPMRAVVFTSFGLPGVWLTAGHVWLPLVACGVFVTGAMWLSRKFNWVSWKIVEAFAGFLQAAGIILCL